MNKETKALLRARAIEMAKEPLRETISSQALELITFTLSTEMYGLESAFIREVYPLKDFTPLPGVPAYILGVINVRGQIIPVIDLKKLFNLSGQGLSELNKVIILQDKQMEFGILTDEVHGTREVEINHIRKAPNALKGVGHEYLMGVTKERLIVLNALNLLNDNSIVVNDVIA